MRKLNFQTIAFTISYEFKKVDVADSKTHELIIEKIQITKIHWKEKCKISRINNIV